MSPSIPNSQFELRELMASDREAWTKARCTLWPDCSIEQAAIEVAVIVDDVDQIAFGVFDGRDLVGFAEYSLHPHAIGCGPGPVAYLEGWWVAESVRRQGIGRMLVDAGIAWGRKKDCREMASDTWVDNVASDCAHRALGFESIEQLIHYRRSI